MRPYKKSGTSAWIKGLRLVPSDDQTISDDFLVNGQAEKSDVVYMEEFLENRRDRLISSQETSESLAAQAIPVCADSSESSDMEVFII
jgi:hypothetical protein